MNTDKWDQILLGDCLDHLRTFEDDSVDCLVTDPPYSYGIRGADWDREIPSVDVWKECVRVQKPGHLLLSCVLPGKTYLRG